MMNPVEETRQYARETILETWPNVKESPEASPNSYEYDAILINDQTCEIASVSIMHDPETESFALVDNPRVKPNATSGKQLSTIPTTSQEINWDKLSEDHAIAYLRGDLATSSPQSYSLAEMQTICADMEASTAEVDAALRADFEALSPVAQDKMLDLLQKADPEHFGWWMETLVGKMPDSAETALSA